MLVMMMMMLTMVMSSLVVFDVRKKTDESGGDDHVGVLRNFSQPCKKSKLFLKIRNVELLIRKVSEYIREDNMKGV